MDKKTSDKMLAYYVGWANGRKTSGPRTKKEWAESPPPKCAGCFSFLKEGDALDCFYPYEVEKNRCRECMTPEQIKSLEDNEAHRIKREEKNK